MDDWHDFLIFVFIILLVAWCIVALPIGRATMRGELLKDGYHVADMNEEEGLELIPGEGKWVIEIWRDGWVKVER